MSDIVRSYDSIRDDLISQDTIKQAKARVEIFIKKTTFGSLHSARQELPYLIQFYPSILKYWNQRQHLATINPTILWSGFTEYSKEVMHAGFDTHHMLRYTVLPPQSTYENILNNVKNYWYPCIIKPDQWERAIGVVCVQDEVHLQERFNDHYESSYRFQIQEYCDLPEEYGLQFYRKITGLEISLVQKNIPHAIGDGKKSLKLLIEQSNYKQVFKEKFLQENSSQLDTIPQAWAYIPFTKKVSISYWTTFSEKILTQEQQAQLVPTIEEILKNNPKLYVWRFDLKAQNLESLIQWDFKIIECNGAWWISLKVYQEHLSIQEKYILLHEHFDTMLMIWKDNASYHTPVKPFTTTEFMKDCLRSIGKKWWAKSNALGVLIRMYWYGFRLRWFGS